MTAQDDDRAGDTQPTERADLPAAAKRALAEAAERRAKADEEAKRANEKGGPAGPEPTRYGDWERKGRAVDFS
ncbi:MAG: DUF1674 domain-containing protein [Pseudomonadota bacterium]